MKSTKALLLSSIFILSISCISAQEATEKHPIGISATVQNGQFGFLVPIWLSDQISIAPSLSISSASGVGTEYGIGIVPRYYLRREKVSPFIGVRAAALFSRPIAGNGFEPVNTTDILLGGAFGADYFFDQQFAVGIELQANLTISDENSLRFNNPGKTNFNTASSIFVSIYF